MSNADRLSIIIVSYYHAKHTIRFNSLPAATYPLASIPSTDTIAKDPNAVEPISHHYVTYLLRAPSQLALLHVLPDVNLRQVKLMGKHPVSICTSYYEGEGAEPGTSRGLPSDQSSRGGGQCAIGNFENTAPAPNETMVWAWTDATKYASLRRRRVKISTTVSDRLLLEKQSYTVGA